MQSCNFCQKAFEDSDASVFQIGIDDAEYLIGAENLTSYLSSTDDPSQQVLICNCCRKQLMKRRQQGALLRIAAFFVSAIVAISVLYMLVISLA